MSDRAPSTPPAAPMADAPSTPRTAARIDARREALWAVPVIALLGAPWMLGVRPGWMLAGIALGLWRLVSVARRLTSARQHEVVFAPSRAADGWLLVSLLLVAAPHAQRLPIWLTVVVAIAFGWRTLTRLGRLAAPPRWLVPPLAAAVSLGVYLQYGTLFGRDAGVALLCLMAGLKLLELRARRDANVLVFLACFLALTHLLYSQSLPVALFSVAAVVAIATSMIGLQQREPNLRASAATALRLTVQSLPLMVVMFVLFPRLPGPLWSLPRDTGRAVTGLSDSMSPGSFGSLSASAEVAFRVEFKGPVPRPSQLYWRGPVFWAFDGLTWSAGPEIESHREGPLTVQPLSAPIEYAMTLEPHDERWLLALDMPVAVPPEGRISQDYQLLAHQPVRTRLRYEGLASVAYRAGAGESADSLARGLQLPTGFNPRTRELARSMRAQAGSERAYVEAVLQHFSTEDYFYTTQPPLLAGPHTVDAFLFDTRRGFCEHYASAFAVMMRAAGIPARVVTGYLGGVVNPVGNYLVVRQAEAHAWNEVWLQGQGWVRVDPTAAVSPSRVQSGIAASVPEADPLPMLVRGNVPLLSRVGFTLDAVTNAWNQWVLAYNAQRQRSLLQDLGLDAPDWQSLSLLMVGAVCVVALLTGVLVLRAGPRRRLDPEAALWDRLSRRLARSGLAREPGEGPRAWAARVGSARPPLAAAMNAIAQRYIDLRYGSPPDPRDRARSRRALARAIDALEP